MHCGGILMHTCRATMYLFSFQVDDLIPHMAKAARIVLMNPANQASVEHFELLKGQWMDNMEKLRGLVDEAIDTAAFIRANGQLLCSLPANINVVYS